MTHRHEDWLAQAQHDLKAAKDSLAAQNYEWVAYQAQQSAEKAVKALLRYYNEERRGHTIYNLLLEAAKFVSVPTELLPKAQELDKHFFQSRYPNGFIDDYPAALYSQATAETCLAFAEDILRYVEKSTP